jgi:nucleoside-diphosphate-sugar epimerase
LRSLPNVELCEGSVEDRDSVIRAAEGVEAIVHSAGLVKAKNRDEFFRVNTEGTENVLAAGFANKTTLRRFVFVSSQAVAGPSDALGNPVDIDAPPRPLTNYGRSKLAAEQKVEASKDELPVVILRPCAIYGPRDREILAFFKAVKAGVLPYMGSTENRLSMIYGPDCAAACVRAIDADVRSGSRYFLDDGKVYRFAEMIEGVEQAMGRRAWLRFPLPRPVIHTAALGSELYGKLFDKAVMLTRDKCQELFEQWVCNSSAAQQALDWQPRVQFDRGAKETVAWYRAAGWL